MRLLSRKSFAGLVLTTLVTACLGFASWGFHKSSDRAINVTFDEMIKFNNGVTLPAGTYRMEVPENSQAPKVTFMQHDKVIATVSAKVIAEQKNNSGTEIESVKQGQAELVTAIRPGGWEETLVFGSAGQHGAVASKQ